MEQNKALLEEKYELMEEKATLEKMLRNHLMHCDRNGSVQIEVPDITSVKINMSPLEISDSDSMEEEAMFFADETLSSDSDSIDLTNDVGDQLLDSSLVDEVMADDDAISSTSHTLHQAVALLNSLGGDCFLSSGDVGFD